jgi:hypothetical protein
MLLDKKHGLSLPFVSPDLKNDTVVQWQLLKKYPRIDVKTAQWVCIQCKHGEKMLEWIPAMISIMETREFLDILINSDGVPTHKTVAISNASRCYRHKYLSESYPYSEKTYHGYP